MKYSSFTFSLEGLFCLLHGNPTLVFYPTKGRAGNDVIKLHLWTFYGQDESSLYFRFSYFLSDYVIESSSSFSVKFKTVLSGPFPAHNESESMVTARGTYLQQGILTICLTDPQPLKKIHLLCMRLCEHSW